VSKDKSKRWGCCEGKEGEEAGEAEDEGEVKLEEVEGDKEEGQDEDDEGEGTEDAAAEEGERRRRGGGGRGVFFALTSCHRSGAWPCAATSLRYEARNASKRATARTRVPLVNVVVFESRTCSARCHIICIVSTECAVAASQCAFARVREAEGEEEEGEGGGGGEGSVVSSSGVE